MLKWLLRRLRSSFRFGSWHTVRLYWPALGQMLCKKGNGYLDSVKVATTRVRPMKMQCTAAPRDRLWRSKDTSGHAHVLVLLLGKTTIGQIFLVLRRAEITSVIANSRTRIDRCVDGWVYPSSAFSSQCAIFTFQPSLDENGLLQQSCRLGFPVNQKRIQRTLRKSLQPAQQFFSIGVIAELLQRGHVRADRHI